MKQDDFERLKAICEKEGFEIIERGTGSTKYFFEVKKTDPWEGVEFVEAITDHMTSFTLGKVYKVSSLKNDVGHVGVCLDDKGGYYNGMARKWFKPSTETAYVDQMKKEAIENLGDFKIYQLDFSMMYGGSIQNKETFVYRKDTDTLYYMGNPIYQQGKWAERVKERVEVESKCNTWCHYGEIGGVLYDFQMLVKKGGGIHHLDKLGRFLASQLEKYLNGEIE